MPPVFFVMSDFNAAGCVDIQSHSTEKVFLISPPFYYYNASIQLTPPAYSHGRYLSLINNNYLYGLRCYTSDSDSYLLPGMPGLQK